MFVSCGRNLVNNSAYHPLYLVHILYSSNQMSRCDTMWWHSNIFEWWNWIKLTVQICSPQWWWWQRREKETFFYSTIIRHRFFIETIPRFVCSVVDLRHLFVFITRFHFSHFTYVEFARAWHSRVYECHSKPSSENVTVRNCESSSEILSLINFLPPFSFLNLSNINRAIHWQLNRG